MEFRIRRAKFQSLEKSGAMFSNDWNFWAASRRNVTKKGKMHISV